MKTTYWMALLCVGIFLSCENKKPEDFTDKVISIILEDPKGESVEFPDLYNEIVKKIPDEKDEKLLLAQRLKSRGFKVKSWERGTSPLGGIRFVSVQLSKENCHCEVTKTYHSTAFVSEYVASERIKCY